MRVGKTVVFNGKMGIRKFGSTAPPFGKVACAVKVYINILKRRVLAIFSDYAYGGRVHAVAEATKTNIRL